MSDDNSQTPAVKEDAPQLSPEEELIKTKEELTKTQEKLKILKENSKELLDELAYHNPTRHKLTAQEKAHRDSLYTKYSLGYWLDMILAYQEWTQGQKYLAKLWQEQVEDRRKILRNYKYQGMPDKLYKEMTEKLQKDYDKEKTKLLARYNKINDKINTKIELAQKLQKQKAKEDSGENDYE